MITEHGTYPFDYLILGMGSEPNDYGTPGVKEHGFTLWSWEDAVRLRKHIEKTAHLAASERDPENVKPCLISLFAVPVLQVWK